jgi:hypothetical protein
LISNNQRDLTYLSGMMMETEVESEGLTRRIADEKRCPHCNKASHQQHTSRLCPKNKQNLERASAIVVDTQKTRKGKNPMNGRRW